MFNPIRGFTLFSVCLLKVYIGGAVEEADRMVATGKAKAEDFRFFLHLCGWAPGQLQAEIDKGVWFPAATSTNVSGI